MNQCRYQQRSNAMGVSFEEERRRLDSVVCPKPRRLGVLNPAITDPIRPLRWPANQQAEIGGDSNAGAELLDIILAKGGYGGERPGNQVASSPPYFSGSPPSRASNPLVQDAQFNKGKLATQLPGAAPPSPSSRMGGGGGGGCVRMKFGQKPAAVRIEGFDCLSRDRRNCSISAVA